MTIPGPAGVGKSALLRALIALVRAPEGKKTRVLLAQASATMKNLDPLGGCKQWLARWRTAGLSAGAVVARIVRDAQLEDGESAEAAAVTAEQATHVLGCMLGEQGDEGQGQASIEEQVTVLYHVLRALACSRMLFLCIEDAEHLDSASLEVLDKLVAGLDGHSIFVLVAVRSTQGVLDATMKGWLGRPGAATYHMDVGRLGTDAARDLVLSCAEGPLPPDVVAYVVTHSDGNCLALEQMTKAFVESNLLFLNMRGEFELEGSMEQLELPRTLMDSIRLRLQTVREGNPGVHLLLKITAVMAGTFTLAVITPVWQSLAADSEGTTDLDLGAALAQAQGELRLLKYLSASGAAKKSEAGQRRRSSNASEGHYAFHHLRIEDCVNETMAREDKARLHAACAACLPGLVDDLVLAGHEEVAGHNFAAAKLFDTAFRSGAASVQARPTPTHTGHDIAVTNTLSITTPLE